MVSISAICFRSTTPRNWRRNSKRRLPARCRELSAYDVPLEGAHRQESGGAHDWCPGHRGSHTRGRAQSHDLAGTPSVRPYRVNSWGEGKVPVKLDLCNNAAIDLLENPVWKDGLYANCTAAMLSDVASSPANLSVGAVATRVVYTTRKICIGAIVDISLQCGKRMYCNLAILAAVLFHALSAAASAPQVRTQGPGFYRIMVGDFEITALSDGTHPFPIDTVIQNVSKQDIALDLSRASLAMPVQGSINAFLINTGSKLILIDSGAGVLYGACCGQLMAK